MKGEGEFLVEEWHLRVLLILGLKELSCRCVFGPKGMGKSMEEFGDR